MPRRILAASAFCAVMAVLVPASARAECEGWFDWGSCNKPGVIDEKGDPYYPEGRPTPPANSGPVRFDDVAPRKESGWISSFFNWSSRDHTPADMRYRPVVDPDLPRVTDASPTIQVRIPSPSKPSILQRFREGVTHAFEAKPAPTTVSNNPFGVPPATTTPSQTPPTPSASFQTPTRPAPIPQVVESYEPPRAPHTGFHSQPQLTPEQVFKVNYAPNPGGVLLSRAAAGQMALDIDIDAAYVDRGTIVLSGRKSRSSIDAALFLTAMRLACERGGDPYFSLDPPDPAAWADQSDRLMSELQEFASARHEATRTSYSVLNVPLSPDHFPALKSELVFKPEWLRDTRFGEIMYRADVLLKELSVGVAVVDPGTRFRGDMVPGYISASQYSVEQGLAGGFKERGRRGFRLWFDITPTGDRSDETATAVIYTSGAAIDLSDVHPKMFVRRHELGDDLPGGDPALDLLSGQVNANGPTYQEAFDELRALAGVFRAYIAALKIAQANPSTCPAVIGIPFSDREKISKPLPRYRDAMSFVALGSKANRRGGYTMSHFTVQGGVAIQGRKLSARALEKETPLATILKREVGNGVPQPVWERDDRRYVAFSIDMLPPPRRVPLAVVQ